MIAEAARVDDFLRRAAAGLRAEPSLDVTPRGVLRGDHALDGVDPHRHGQEAPRAAAVLVPIVLRDEEPTVLLTERATGLRQHSGQIAFPGGRVDPEDASPLEAALREAEEEIGLDRRHVQAIGYLDTYLSGTNYLVVPAVGLVSPGFTLELNADEVADAFEVPLAFLMDEANHQLHSREWQGRLRRYYAIPFGERYIWGVTAGILRNLHERLYGP